MVKDKELKLLMYINDHMGEEVTARKIYEDLKKLYGYNSGFKSSKVVAQVLIRYRKPIRKEKKTNVYLL